MLLLRHALCPKGPYAGVPQIEANFRASATYSTNLPFSLERMRVSAPVTAICENAMQSDGAKSCEVRALSVLYAIVSKCTSLSCNEVGKASRRLPGRYLSPDTGTKVRTGGSKSNSSDVSRERSQ